MIEILCTIAGVIAGVAIVGSLFREDTSRAKFQAEDPAAEPTRIKEIANQLQQISARVAANVSAHSDKVEHFTEQLGDSDSESGVVFTAIDEIIEANRAMQAELANAQKRIAEQSEMIEQASQQARTDALTGLANRRALDEHLSNVIEYAADGDFVGLLLMDIDHFKNFNDSFGHTTGDAVLASFARSMTKCCGPDDYAARYGGEEFAVVLSANSKAELIQKAGEVRFYVSEQIIGYEDLQLKVTASAGLCTLTPDDSINSAYERADEGLYKAKEAGRNRGYWLSEQDWQPFPEATDRQSNDNQDRSAENSAKRRNESANATPANSPPSSVAASAPVAAPAPETVLSSGETILVVNDEPDDRSLDQRMDVEDSQADRAEVLDLKSFLVRLDASLEQLRRAEMPSTGLMIQAISLQHNEQELLQSWDEVVRLIQCNLRGIDLVCHYRPNTLCIFMSGCSQNVALDRAARIQASFVVARNDWKSPCCPDRFAISVAKVEPHEESTPFLNRLEAALDDAQHAGESEVVIHDGESLIYQQV